MSGKIIRAYGLELRPVVAEDIERLYQWNNTAKIQKMLGRTPTTLAEQRSWYEKIKNNLNEAHWIVRVDGTPTGYIGVLGQAPLTQEQSIDIEMYASDSKARHPLLGIAMGLIIPSIVFDILNIPQIKTSVHVENPMIKFNLALGYEIGSRAKDFVEMSLVPEQYNKEKVKFSRYFSDQKIIYMDT